MLQCARAKDGKHFELACQSNSKIYGLNKGYRQILKNNSMKGLMKGCGMVKAPRRNQQLYKWDKLETKKI